MSGYNPHSTCAVRSPGDGIRLRTSNEVYWIDTEPPNEDAISVWKAHYPRAEPQEELIKIFSITLHDPNSLTKLIEFLNVRNTQRKDPEFPE